MKTQTDNQVDELEYQLQDIKQKLAELRRQRPREEIRDYQVLDSDGREVRVQTMAGRRRVFSAWPLAGAGESHAGAVPAAVSTPGP